MSLVTAVFEVPDSGGIEEAKRFLALLEELSTWEREGWIASHDTAQGQLGRRSGQGLLLRIEGAPEGIERVRFRLGKPVLVADEVCDLCFTQPASVVVADSYDGSEYRVSLCSRCGRDDRGSAPSAADRALMAEVVDEWVARALSTAPVDRYAAESALRDAYVAAGYRPPSSIVWLPSHPAAALVASTIAGISEQRTPRQVDAVDDPVLVELAGAAGRTLYHRVARGAKDTVEALVRPHVSPLLWKRIEIDVRRRVGDLVGRRLWRPVGDELWSLVRSGFETVDGTDLVERSWNSAVEQLAVQTSWVAAGGVDWSRARAVWRLPSGEPRRAGVLTGAECVDWLATADFLVRRALLRPAPASFHPLCRLTDVAEAWWAFEHLAVVAERPVAIRLDEQRHVHNPDGPAIEYADGFAVHAWHGQRVASSVVLAPETISVDDIDGERNEQVRLVLVERFGGWERYLVESGAEVVQRDDCGSLWRKSGTGAEPILLLEIVNATVSLDGTPSRKVLRVPPTMGTARQAMAWTFGLDEAEYRPAIEV